jgi:hypothetical protein
MRDISDLSRYHTYLRSVSALSRLFSDNVKPLINYRTAEKLFNLMAGATDLGRQDGSFDSSLTRQTGTRVGVGVKTFTANSINESSTEKIAEFSNPAFTKILSQLSGKNLAERISDFRNSRVRTDALQLELDIEQSYYHCVVRLPGAVIVHEEPYALIDINSLFPTDAKGNKIASWESRTNGHLYFGDAQNLYTFHTGKNVLHKRFDLGQHFTSAPIRVAIVDQIFDMISKSFGAQLSKELLSELGAIEPRTVIQTDPLESIVLPLYSPKKFVVQPKSGINSWNAAGRDRKFGEAYISVPKIVHKLMPEFFPEKDFKFSVRLPNGQEISAKVCQQDSKALMSDPNTDLCIWLYTLIDGDIEIAKRRSAEGRPYTYSDLLRIGKDSVVITKTNRGGPTYTLELVSIGSFERFIDRFEK